MAYHPLPAARAVTEPRVVLLDFARDEDGMPRPAVLFPGRALPTVFRNMTAALAATRPTHSESRG